MKTRFLTYTALMVSFLWNVQSIAQDSLIQSNDLGTTDWIEGYVEASGNGTSRYMGNRIQEELMAKQAARTTAQSRLLEMINGVRLTGISTLGAQGLGDTRAASRIKGTLRGARLVSEKVTWHEDKSSRRGEVPMAEVTLRLCMSPVCKDTPVNLTTASLFDSTQKTVTKLTEKSVQSDGPSAIIIDLEQALYLPALAPEVINEDNETIYSQDIVDQDAIQQNGLIHYSKSVEKARMLPVSGSNPRVIKAVRITKDNRIVLSNSDGARLVGLKALSLAHVIVALD